MYCMYTSLPEDLAGTVKPYCFLSEYALLESNKNTLWYFRHLVNMYSLGFKFVVQNIVKNKAYLIWELQKCNLNNMAQYIPLGRVPQSTVLHLLLFSHCIPEINIRIPEQIRFLLFLWQPFHFPAKMKHQIRYSTINYIKMKGGIKNQIKGISDV